MKREKERERDSIPMSGQWWIRILKYWREKAGTLETQIWHGVCLCVHTHLSMQIYCLVIEQSKKALLSMNTSSSSPLSPWRLVSYCSLSSSQRWFNAWLLCLFSTYYCKSPVSSPSSASLSPSCHSIIRYLSSQQTAGTTIKMNNGFQ